MPFASNANIVPWTNVHVDKPIAKNLFPKQRHDAQMIINVTTSINVTMIINVTTPPQQKIASGAKKENGIFIVGVANNMDAIVQIWHCP